MKIYWNKRKRLHKERVLLPEEWFEHQHGRRFIVLEHQYDRRNVTRKHSILLILELKMIQRFYLRVRIRIADCFTVTMS